MMFRVHKAQSFAFYRRIYVVRLKNHVFGLLAYAYGFILAENLIEPNIKKIIQA